MEARLFRAVFVAALLVISMGARHRTANFIVETADPQLAKQFAEAAENYRAKLAVSWLGEPLPNWAQPCPIKIAVGPNLGAGGATTFTFDRGEVFGWNMSIQGSAERVMDSVLPHEITHMIFASHFRRPLPRWADEGGATSVEHVSERNKQRKSLDQYLRTGRGIAFNKMFAMTEYPADILPLYAQGYSTAEYLIQTGGRRRYIAFLDDGLKEGDWPAALQKNYGIQNVGELQNTWLAWVKQGSPLKSQPAPLPAAAPTMIAAIPSPAPTAKAASSEPVVLPRRPLAPVASQSGASAPVAAIVNADVPYTPGSTIAVSRLSIPSTGWRSAVTLPISTPAMASAPSAVASDPYRAHVSRPATIDAPTRTTMLR